jgi:nicotinamide riboside kinase
VARVVTLLGGESTGKTSLALSLCERLNHMGVASCVVAEHLRLWCEVKGRAPHAHEQSDLALEQATHIEQAADRPDVQLVIADTTPLVIAAYSEVYFSDRGLLQKARVWQQGVDLTLVMGLDLPWVPDGFFRDSPAIRDATDAVLRRELLAGGIPFQTVHGIGDARSDQAMRAIGNLLGRDDLTTAHSASSLGRVPWICEKCSDPGCEHRLFSGLISRGKAREASP